MKTLSKFLVGAPLSLATVLAMGCPPPVVVTDDAGMVGNDAPTPRDTGNRRDAAMTMLSTCEAPRMVMGSLTAPVTIAGNTMGGAEGPLTVAPCGSMPMGARPPQDVIALQVPGTGPMGVAMDFTGGDETFDMIVQVRTDCMTAPTAANTCFDDAADGTLQPVDGFIAMGGSTIFLVISGYANPGMGSTDRGAYSGTVRFAPNTPPTLTAASATRDATNLQIIGTGMDAESNATGFNVQFLDAAGMPISIVAGNPAAVGPFGFEFDTAPTTMAFTDATSTFALADLTEGAAAAVAAAVSVRVSAVDLFNQTSATRDVALVTPMEVPFGAVCDATHVCASPNECTMGTCQAPAAVRTACMGATAVTLTAPTGAMPTVSAQSVMLAAGPGALTNTCGGAGAERIFNVTVPAGGADLIATTNVAATASTVNTVVAIRSTCGNSASETLCNDDYMGHPAADVRSTAVVMAAPAGMYTVIVDSSTALTAAATAGLELRLRPVLAAAAACDPTGEMNRCATGVCPATGAAVCP